MKVQKQDSLEFLMSQADFENDIIFADPPYALGSEIIIRKDGKVDYAKASDFMNKWEMPTGVFWEAWFKEAYRTLKHGGYVLMYGMDRQLLLFKYYASLAGFQEQQSIYWYYISNFPKATNLSLSIDKNAGVQGQVGKGGFNVAGRGEQDNRKAKLFDRNEVDSGVGGYNEPKTDLAKKYDGYKYSVAPLKQTCETIMVFKKPNKTGSVLHDTLAMENGDETITCSALDIEGNRVKTKDNLAKQWERKQSKTMIDGTNAFGKGLMDIDLNGYAKDARYPSQTFIDSQVAEKLDLQSGVNVGQQGATTGKEPSANKQGRLYNDYSGYGKPSEPRNDFGGCSKILHKCDYEKIDFDLFIYEPKVDSGERNNGLDEFEPKLSASSEFRPNHLEKTLKGENGNPYGRWKMLENNHPTLKPIDLNCKILKLFKTPNEQRICYPFAGSGSEIIGGLKANFQNWSACEINADYVEIANARIKHYKENEYVQIDLFGGL